MEVQLRLSDDRVHLSVLDEGPGFELPERPIVDARGPGRLGALPGRPLRRALGQRTGRAPSHVARTGARACRLRSTTGRARARRGDVLQRVRASTARLEQALRRRRAQPRRRPHRRHVHRLLGSLGAADRLAPRARARRRASRSCWRRASRRRSSASAASTACSRSTRAARRRWPAWPLGRPRPPHLGPRAKRRRARERAHASRVVPRSVSSCPAGGARRLRGGRALRPDPGARGARRAGRDRVRDERRRDQRRGRRRRRRAARGAPGARRSSSTGARCARAA